MCGLKCRTKSVHLGEQCFMPLPDKHSQVGRIKSPFRYYLEQKKDTPLPERNTAMTFPIPVDWKDRQILVSVFLRAPFPRN